MARYIDAEKLIAEYDRVHVGAPGGARKLMVDAPTADVVEVRHGEWILHPDGSGTCKICNTHQKAILDMDNWQNFCGHCGAKMDGTLKERGGEK